MVDVDIYEPDWVLHEMTNYEPKLDEHTLEVVTAALKKELAESKGKVLHCTIEIDEASAHDLAKYFLHEAEKRFGLESGGSTWSQYFFETMGKEIEAELGAAERQQKEDETALFLKSKTIVFSADGSALERLLESCNYLEDDECQGLDELLEKKKQEYEGKRGEGIYEVVEVELNAYAAQRLLEAVDEDIKNSADTSDASSLYIAAETREAGTLLKDALVELERRQ